MPRFTDATLPECYPAQRVAANDALLTFTSDTAAEMFRAWWGEDGVALFAKWCALQSIPPAPQRTYPRLHDPHA